MNERDLLTLKNRIEQAKNKVSELRGRKSYLVQELQEKWGCSTIQQAETKIAEFKADIAKLDAQISKGINKLTEEITNED